jgi:hypothetical protein
MEISATVDQIRSEEEQLRQRKQDAARDLRARAADLRTECESALAEAADLETQANEFDPPKPDPEGIPRPTSPIAAMIDAACGVTEDDYSGESKRTRTRSRKPRSVKANKPTGPRPDGSVTPTPKLVLKALEASGGKANKSTIQKQGDFVRALLSETIAAMLEGGTLAVTGKGKGAGTTYRAV